MGFYSSDSMAMLMLGVSTGGDFEGFFFLFVMHPKGKEFIYFVKLEDRLTSS